MSDRKVRRRPWVASGLACSLAAGVVAVMLLFLQDPASAGKPVAGQRAAQASPEETGVLHGWRTVFSDTFSGEVGPDWFTTNTSSVAGAPVLWGTSAFTYMSPPHSAWCAGGAKELGGVYTGEMDSWLVSSPIQLGGPGYLPWDAELRFAWWLDADAGARECERATRGKLVRRLNSLPQSGDRFGWGILTDVTHLEGGQWTYVSGATAGWMRGWLPLDDFLPLTQGLTSSVHVAFRFVSNDDGAVGRGAFVDDVVVRHNEGYQVALPMVVREASSTQTSTTTTSSLLENGSFESDWTDMAIGQQPDDWEWHWVDGETLPGSDMEAAAPETNVKPRDQFPPGERDLFVLDGLYCVKVFKSGAPMYAALSQRVSGLEVGRAYRLTAPIYVDVFTWEGAKVPPNDPWAAQVRLGAAPTNATWRDEESISYGPWCNGDNTEDFYLAYNEYHHQFTAEASEMRVYVEVFAKWGLENNGFFMDNVRLLPLP